MVKVVGLGRPEGAGLRDECLDAPATSPGSRSEPQPQLARTSRCGGRRVCSGVSYASFVGFSSQYPRREADRLKR